MPTIQDRYRYWRKHTATATQALQWARAERTYRDAFERFGEWEFDFDGFGYARTASAEHGSGVTLHVTVSDDDQPYDWGDIEPSEAERDNLSAYVVSLTALDKFGGVIASDSIGGVDAIDLPGYLQRTWEDAAGMALVEYLLPEVEHAVTTETRERAEWEARDTITV